jgi:hypothetical protein
MENVGWKMDNGHKILLNLFENESSNLVGNTCPANRFSPEEKSGAVALIGFIKQRSGLLGKAAPTTNFQNSKDWHQRWWRKNPYQILLQNHRLKEFAGCVVDL